LAASLVMWHRS